MNDNDEITDFERLYRQYYPTLCGIGRGYIRNMAIVEELVDDVFVRYWNNRHKITIHISLKDYLFKSIKNACIDYLRTEQKQKMSYLEGQEIVCTTLADLGEDPLEYLISAETEQKIMNAINELPERYRQTFILCRLDEMRHDDVAKVMGISKNTVKSNLRDASAMLLEKLKCIIISLLIFFL